MVTHNEEKAIDNQLIEIKQEQKSTDLAKIRYLSIDVFRAIAIIGMIFVDVIAPFDKVPSWSKHAPNYGLTYVDLVAPLFIFAIGLTYKISYNSNYKKHGWLHTFLRFLRRYAAFIGMGILGSVYFVTSDGIKFSWAVLQAIGVAGIFTLLFLHVPRIVRFLLCFIFLGVYQYILTISIQVEGMMMTLGQLAWVDEHGGIIGGIGFSIMMLLSVTIIEDFRKTDKKQILSLGILLTILGIALHLIWYYTEFPPYGGISKEHVTPAYVLLTAGLGAILFWIIWFVYDYKKLTKNKSILQPMGKNSFFLYILHPLFILLASLLLPQDSHVVLVIFFGILSVVLLWLVAFLLDKKKIYIII